MGIFDFILRTINIVFIVAIIALIAAGVYAYHHKKKIAKEVIKEMVHKH